MASPHSATLETRLVGKDWRSDCQVSDRSDFDVALPRGLRSSRKRWAPYWGGEMVSPHLMRSLKSTPQEEMDPRASRGVSTSFTRCWPPTKTFLGTQICTFGVVNTSPTETPCEHSMTPTKKYLGSCQWRLNSKYLLTLWPYSTYLMQKPSMRHQGPS